MAGDKLPPIPSEEEWMKPGGTRYEDRRPGPRHRTWEEETRDKTSRVPLRTFTLEEIRAAMEVMNPNKMRH